MAGHWSAARKATVLIPSGPLNDPDRKHLHIVLTDPDPQSEDVLIVSVCSIPRSNIYDTSCTLFPGEHPFIVRDSYIAYRFLRLVGAADLEAKVTAGHYVAQRSVDEKLFDFIATGLVESPDTEPRFLRFFQRSTMA